MRGAGQVRGRHARVGAGRVAQAAERAAGRRARHVRGVQAARGRRGARAGLRPVRARLPRALPRAARGRVRGGRGLALPALRGPALPRGGRREPRAAPPPAAGPHPAL